MRDFTSKVLKSQFRIADYLIDKFAELKPDLIHDDGKVLTNLVLQVTYSESILV